MPHPNELMVYEAFSAFSVGDLEAVGRTWAPDIVWHVPGRSQVAGDHKGAGEILVFLTKLDTLTKGTFKVELQNALCNDEIGFSLHRWMAELGGKPFVSFDVLVYRFEDGEVAEIWSHPFDHRLAEDLFS